MDREKVAEILDGYEYPFGVDRETEKAIAKHGLVVVYGHSDDLLKFQGAISDDVEAYEGATVRLHDGKVFNPEEGDLDVLSKYGVTLELSPFIQAIWDPKEIDASWLIKTEIPHSTFLILEDGETYCQGIVFNLSDAS